MALDSNRCQPNTYLYSAIRISVPMKRKILITKDRRAFTLIEIVVTIAIIGAITGFALVNYNKAVESGYCQDAQNQLKMIQAAEKLYDSNNDSYWPPDAADHDLANINLSLTLGIVANEITYSCTGIGGGTGYSCSAERKNSSGTTMYTLTVTQSDSPLCSPAGGYTCPCCGGP
jgi:prepilin-type N-terminal cleavage/methylation domain-containing protein